MTSTGLLYEDEFTTAISADWTISGLSFVINAGKARGLDSSHLNLKTSVVAARNVAYAQVLTVRIDTNAVGTMWLRRHTSGGDNGYYTQGREANTQIWRAIDGSYVNIASPGGNGNADGVEVRQNFYVADGVQRNWKDGSQVSSLTDANHNGVPGNVDLWARGDGAADGATDFDDFIYMTEKSIVATGLLTGEKFKILNDAEGVVGSATESSGTATLDLGGVLVPIGGGWPTAIITDGSDVELLRLTGEHYPGGVYTRNE
jgi:hypothetical protein